MRMRNYDCFSCLDATNISREAVCKFKTCNSATTARIKLSLNFCSAIVKSSPLLRPNVSNCIAHNKEAARECAERPYKQEPRSGCGRGLRLGESNERAVCQVLAAVLWRSSKWRTIVSPRRTIVSPRRSIVGRWTIVSRGRTIVSRGRSVVSRGLSVEARAWCAAKAVA